MPEKSFVDLHLHSNHSDGSDAPARVVERAAELGLAAIALTDHDTVSGVPEATEAAESHGIECLPGVEISSQLGKKEVHILGLGVNLSNEQFIAALSTQVEERKARAAKMVARLNELGVPVTLKAVQERAGEGAIGRMHLAQEIVASGYAETVQGAFDKYIKGGRPAYVPKAVIDIKTSLELIHGAGGLAFVAHPGLGSQHTRLDALLAHPFDGIEVLHSRHNAAQVAHFQEIAEARGLLMTGGSDCHGTVKGDKPLMGNVQVPYAYYARIKEALGR